MHPQRRITIECHNLSRYQLSDGMPYGHLQNNPQTQAHTHTLKQDGDKSAKPSGHTLQSAPRKEGACCHTHNCNTNCATTKFVTRFDLNPHGAFSVRHQVALRTHPLIQVFVLPCLWCGKRIPGKEGACLQTTRNSLYKGTMPPTDSQAILKQTDATRAN